MQRDGQRDRGIDHEAITEDRLPDDAHPGEHRDLCLKGLVDEALGGCAAVEDVHAEEVGYAHAERREREAGDILVGAQADGQEAVDQTARHRRQEGADERQDHAQRHIRVRGGVLIDIRAGEACEAAQIHDARHTQVQIAGLFRDDFAHRAVHDDRPEGDGAKNPCNQRIHQRTSLVPLLRRIL